MAKAITTIKRVLNYPTDHEMWFAVNQALFNQIAAFYLEMMQTQEKFLDFSNKEALRTRATHEGFVRCAAGRRP